MTRRWRGMADMPLTKAGRISAIRMARNLGEVDRVFHDRLERCVDTAKAIKAPLHTESDGPLPWDMGELFQGREITKDSLNLAKYYIYDNPHGIPPRGESFRAWEERWNDFIRNLQYGFAAVAVVTHNRNIQYLYATQYGKLSKPMYDVEGPHFCSVHYFDKRTGLIAPWSGKAVPPGIYLVRHGETTYGT